MRNKNAFTLIELLIVVAIIAILAAIAVPNFLEAQTRSKVSRVRADFRAVATGIESYRVDNGKMPRWEAGTTLWHQGTSSLWRQLTTPIAYVTSSVFIDPFVITKNADWKWYGSAFPSIHPTIWGNTGRIRDWSIRSFGPDIDDDALMNGPDYAMYSIIIYDATNGTVSNGDIWLIDGNNAPDGKYELRR